MKKLISFTIAAAMLVGLCACSSTDEGGSTAASGDTKMVTDIVGNEVEVPSDPQSIAAMVGPTYEMVFMLDEADRITMVKSGHVSNYPLALLTNPELENYIGLAANPSSSVNIEDYLSNGIDLVLYYETDTEHAYSIMEELGIAHLAGKRYTQISGGERQLVLIARTLCQEPEMILFDEPTSHLDFKNQAMVLRTVKKLSAKGMTIVMTSHFPNHVWKIGTRVAMLSYNGMVAQGPVDEVMTEENLSKTYGIDVKIYNAVSGDQRTRFCDPNLD